MLNQEQKEVAMNGGELLWSFQSLPCIRLGDFYFFIKGKFPSVLDLAFLIPIGFKWHNLKCQELCRVQRNQQGWTRRINLICT